ncbi:hypothetical protein RHSIM_Rhsim05G0164800 [Rhododendron simsii]|uniref:RanBP2-type domain-containing protein n=1 Tax=Rhododendron simsii TaxID=118357 RepID=A0A834GZJ2_RHOSS|nr:hypothetical protein RHSIM_Rhsim05G0164800 [Rhododendron simsii]
MSLKSTAGNDRNTSLRTRWSHRCSRQRSSGEAGEGCGWGRLVFVLRVTRNYFENLVSALENGLSDVDTRGACCRTASSKSLGGGASSSKGKGVRGKGITSRWSTSTRNLGDSGHWSCDYCTFANPKSATLCQMCQQRR